MSRRPQLRRLTATQQAQLLLSMERVEQELDHMLDALDQVAAACRRIHAILEAAAPWVLEERRRTKI